MDLVNNSQPESGYFHTILTQKVKKHDGTYTSPCLCTRTPCGGAEVNCARNDACNGFGIHGDGKVHNAARLAPGQMEIRRIVAEGERISYRLYGKEGFRCTRSVTMTGGSFPVGGCGAGFRQCAKRGDGLDPRGKCGRSAGRFVMGGQVLCSD